jgi:hypothetical protein
MKWYRVKVYIPSEPGELIGTTTVFERYAKDEDDARDQVEKDDPEVTVVDVWEDPNQS